MKLAEALLLRKDLQQKVDRLKVINNQDLFEFKMQRQPVGDGIDDIKAQVPKIAFQQFTHCYDWHAKQLRRIDAAIQQANWAVEVENVEDVAQDYVDPYVEVTKK